MNDLTVPGALPVAHTRAQDRVPRMPPVPDAGEPGDVKEALIRDARRSRAFGWLGVLALVGPWCAGRLLGSVLSGG